MAKLSPEQEKQLKDLTDLANSPDDDDDDEIEWWEEDDKGKRRGGRMTVRRAKSSGLFSDLFTDKPKTDDKKGGKAEDKGDGKQDPPSQRYFGSGQRGKKE